MLKKGDRVRIFGRSGMILDFIQPSADDDSLGAVVQTDEAVSFEGVIGNIVIMQLRYAAAVWGADHDVMRTVGADLCPNLDAWFKNSGCVQLGSHLIYEVLQN